MNNLRKFQIFGGVALILILVFNARSLVYWHDADIGSVNVHNAAGGDIMLDNDADDLALASEIVEDAQSNTKISSDDFPFEENDTTEYTTTTMTDASTTQESVTDEAAPTNAAPEHGSIIDSVATNLTPDEQQILDNAMGIVQSVAFLGKEKQAEMSCPTEHSLGSRYEVLKLKHNKKHEGIHYMFTLNLYQAATVIERLLISIVEAADYLGPENCALSIVEGRSTDGTWQILDGIKAFMESRNIRYFLQTSDIAPLEQEGKHRIKRLARLRNLALNPLTEDEDGLFAATAKVIFINDVVFCPDDILELLYQHDLQGAVQTCAMDFIQEGRDFYDVWVSRTMTGDLFWPMVAEAPWRNVHELFWDDPLTKGKWERRQPFQVFSCWGGMTVIEGFPFASGMLQFRANAPGECYGGEPQLLATDLFRLGLPFIQTVPSVAVGYENEHTGNQVKQEQGYVHDRVPMNTTVKKFDDDKTTERITWLPPPTTFRCMPDIGSNTTTNTYYDLTQLISPS